MDNTKRMSSEILESLDELTKGHFIVFDESGVYKTKYLEYSDIVQLRSIVNWTALYQDFLVDDGKKMIEVMDSNLNYHYFSVEGQRIILDNEDQIRILAHFSNMTTYQKQAFELHRSQQVSAVMLEINEAIFTAKSETEICRLALQSSIKAMQKSNYGSIMLKEEDHFKTIAYEGYTDDIQRFRLPCRESFLYLNTNGEMNRFVLVDESKIVFNREFIQDITEGRKIKSVMTGPIFLNNELFAMISVDSFQSNAFDELDLKILTSLARTTELALEHHFRYQARKERSK